MRGEESRDIPDSSKRVERKTFVDIIACYSTQRCCDVNYLHFLICGEVNPGRLAETHLLTRRFIRTQRCKGALKTMLQSHVIVRC